jgi:glycosyltransferase involved in cell wall biosynthesis
VVITLTTVAAELEKMGHDILFVTPASFRTWPCPTYPEIRLALFPGGGIRRVMESASPDAVHIATEGPLGIAARRYCVRRGLPFTTAYHTRFPEYLRARAPIPKTMTYAWLRRFHGRAERVLVPTPSIRGELVARGFPNCVIWPRGVDLTSFNPEGAAVKRPADGKPVFLYTGRVSVEKNINAFLNLDLPGHKWVVGGGPDLDRLRRQYPKVHFAGPQPHAELPRFYRAADVFIFPSRTDTFGLVLLEALACGVPVAAYPVAGPIDVIGAEGPGALDLDLRRAAMRALDIPRTAAREYAMKYSWNEVARLFLSYLAPLTEVEAEQRAAARGSARGKGGSPSTNAGAARSG